jgi:HD-GYP domain-containing protein (c-di-GMP phosphodiesterase class II)
MTRDRLHSRGRSREEALKVIRDESGRLFDPAIARAFITCMD